RRLPSLAVNPDKSSRFAASTDDPDSFTKGASPLKWRPRVQQMSKRGQRTSSTELQRTVADQLIRLVRLDCPDERRRAAASGLSLAQ
ncbi:MAG: hypothetical protein ACRDPU_09475, partial [Thermoleophilia bacterium]